MTLWNPLNVFSSRAHSAAEAPSASFDPSRTGDPLGPRPADPAIGFGGTQVGSAVGSHDPQRNPIGFAPPAERDAAPQYRTEISFRRHHESPRASASPMGPDDGLQPAWHSPEQIGSADVDPVDTFEETVPDETPVFDESDARDESAMFDEAEVVEDTEVVEESVPFYKREISFRRKKTAPALDVVATEDTSDQVELDDMHVGEAEVSDDVMGMEDDWVAPALAPTEAPDELELAEISAVHEEEVEHEVEVDNEVEHESGHDDEVLVEDAEPETLVAAEALTVDEEPAESVPFYKREISFRRKKPATDVVAAAVVADAVADVDEDETPEFAVEADDHAMSMASVEAEDTDDHGFEEPHEVEAQADEPIELEHEVAATVDEPAASDDVPEVPAVAAEAPEFEIAAEHEPEASDEMVDDLPSADAERDLAPVFPIGFASSSDTYASSDDTFASSDDATELTWPADEEPFESEPVEDVAALEDVETFDEESLLPAAVAVAAEAVEDADSFPDLPDALSEDAPTSGGRFGSRKRKTEKAPKRNGGKGRKVVGLKIGASQLAAAVVTETEGRHELLGLARRPLAAGIVVDGEVRDEQALAGAVRSFFDDEKLPKGDVRIGLSSNRIGVRTLDIDVEDESRFDNAVRFKAHEVLPVALSESVLDYRVLEERLAEDGTRVRRVLLVVAPRDQVEPYTRVANLAGIRLDAVDLEALGLLRAFVEPGTGAPTADDTASVVVSIGHESSTLLVAGAGACEFTRVFDWGGGALEDAIASALEVRPAEAATILRHLSLSGPGRAYESLDDVTRAKATDAVRQRLTPFARELVNSLQFYQTQASSLGIGGIQVTGGTSHLEGIDDALHQMIGVNVSVGDPLARVVRGADFDPALESMIGSLAVPIGLAIDDAAMRGVNLLPKNLVAKKSRRSTLIAIGAPVAVAVPIAALGFLYVGAHGKVVKQQKQLDAATAEFNALPVPAAPVIDNAVVGDEAVRATAVASVLGGRLAWEAVFRDMSKVLPANVWLQTLTLTAPDGSANLADGTLAAAPATPGAQPVPTAVAIDGFTFTQPDVARLLARLATLPSLSRVTLTSSTSQLVGTKKAVHFTIVADLNQTGGAS